MTVAGLAILVLGAGSGFALGGFATGETRSFVADAAPLLPDTQDDALADAPTPVLATGPDRYTCRGCGPTLAERRAQSYAAQYAAADPGYDAAYDLAADYAPLPAYRPMPYEGDEAADPVMMVQ